MGLFFVRKRPKDWIPSPPGVRDSGEKTTFSWGRLIFAVVLLALVLIACIYAGTRPPVGDPPKNPLEGLYTILLHSFELLLGAVIGILTGEAVHRDP